ncbi:hypothetical protein FA15DRAFT_673926 [Coprinopsis marcescibilis]|uniref:DRBM domain-containing protein n=1 Tax=Coprinopsis marcescibilis TaxID=230819 RepID=A0A5C3KID7_COPMA|nr:hypothetical protein FA15DRAFT_673926 [Coprinopsis marcescibilis]
MATLPPLPKIEGDVELLLDVFTHESLRLPDTPLNEDYGDTNRLAALGAHVLELVVATHWFHAKGDGFLPADKLKEKIKESLSETTVNSWMNEYGLKSKLRIAPSAMKVVESNQEMRKVFETYVGAVYFRNRNGFQEIQSWISRLIDPTNASATLDSIPDHSAVQPPAHARAPAPAPAYTSQYGYNFSQYAQPPPPKSPPPPIPGPPQSQYASYSQAPAGSHLSMVSVALLNQKAAQNGLQVTYPAEHSGPPHAPTWNVRCCLNGREYGRGIGKSQKIAKEEAARHAWAAMGW